MDGVNNTFSGSLTVKSNLNATSISCTNLSCTSLCLFINTSIIMQCTNYNSSLVTFINTSIMNSQTNLLNVTHLSATNASFSNAYVTILNLTIHNQIMM